MEDLTRDLLRQKENSEDEFALIEVRLKALLKKEVVQIARHLKAKLAGAGKKDELVARLISKSRLGVLQDPATGHAGTANVNVSQESSDMLALLPSFQNVSQWSKAIANVLENFHFAHLHVYLVESRDKTFYAQSMKAF